MTNLPNLLIVEHVTSLSCGIENANRMVTTTSAIVMSQRRHTNKR